MSNTGTIKSSVYITCSVGEIVTHTNTLNN